MRHYQVARLLKDFEFGTEVVEKGTEAIVLDEFVILRDLKYLSEQTKHDLIGEFLRTRNDKFLVIFADGRIALFNPDDVRVYSWCKEEVA